MIADILRGYLGRNLVGRLDFSTLQQVSAERVTPALKRRLNDAAWRVRCDAGTWVWVYLILEFQSVPEPRIALRMLGYVAAPYEDLDRIKEFRRKKVPTVLAVLLYNGEREWVESLRDRGPGWARGSADEEAADEAEIPAKRGGRADLALGGHGGGLGGRGHRGGCLLLLPHG